MQTKTYQTIRLLLKRTRKSWKWLRTWLEAKVGEERYKKIPKSYTGICKFIAYNQEEYKILVLDLAQFIFSYNQQYKKIEEIVGLHTTKSINEWINKELI